MGSPWSSSLFESTTDNCILPLENIHSLLLSAEHVLEEETVPLLA